MTSTWKECWIDHKRSSSSWTLQNVNFVWTSQLCGTHLHEWWPKSRFHYSRQIRDSSTNMRSTLLSHACPPHLSWHTMMLRSQLPWPATPHAMDSVLHVCKIANQLHTHPVCSQTQRRNTRRLKRSCWLLYLPELSSETMCMGNQQSSKLTTSPWWPFWEKKHPYSPCVIAKDVASVTTLRHHSGV